MDENKAEVANEVAIQGVEGSFHHIAALRFLGNYLRPVACNSFASLVSKVLYRDYQALMAIENSLAGSLMENYRLLDENELSVNGEIYLRIKQNLLAKPGTAINEITKVYSHPMALAQCAGYFEKWPKIKLIESDDTAGSAKKLAENGSIHGAAIASRLAAKIYGLDVVAEEIEDNKHNYTRFLAISKKQDRQSGTKACISFSLKHQTGSLHKLLGAAADQGWNLTKITSSPIIGKPWEYRFFADLQSETALNPAVLEKILKPHCLSLKILGIFEPGKHHKA